jgi:hypothetical protein
MKWYNLKNNKCPKCSSVLTGKEDSVMLNCSKPDCDFKIGTEKFTELSNAYVQKYNRQDKFDDMGGWGRFEG